MYTDYIVTLSFWISSLCVFLVLSKLSWYDLARTWGAANFRDGHTISKGPTSHQSVPLKPQEGRLAGGTTRSHLPQMHVPSNSFLWSFSAPSYHNLYFSHLFWNTCQCRYKISDCVLETRLRSSQCWRNQDSKPIQGIVHRVWPDLWAFGRERNSVKVVIVIDTIRGPDTFLSLRLCSGEIGWWFTNASTWESASHAYCTLYLIRKGYRTHDLSLAFYHRNAPGHSEHGLELRS